MHIVFLTYGLTQGNCRLMPWRYVLEVAKGIIQTGNDATVITDMGHDSIDIGERLLATKALTGGFSKENMQYRDCIGRIRPDAIYVPVSRRSAISRKISLPETIPHFAYFPSAWYEAKSTWGVCRHLPPRDACVYLVESLVPGTHLVRTLRREGFVGMVTITEYTARKLLENGWDESMLKTLPPGIDLFRQSGKAPEAFKKNVPRINGRQYLLFMGPPTAIRGVYFLLEGFDRAADVLPNVLLVCLLRKGMREAEALRMKRTVKELRHVDRVILIEENLTEEDIVAFIKGSRAVALPFLVVPSEIPLAVIESMILNKPVIITETGGTSEFIGGAGRKVLQNDLNGLSKSIVEVFSDEAGYQSMCEEAGKIIRKQPRWNQVAASLIDFTRDTLCALSAPRTG